MVLFQPRAREARALPRLSSRRGHCGITGPLWLKVVTHVYIRLCVPEFEVVSVLQRRAGDRFDA